jgi:hypothetical protein
MPDREPNQQPLAIPVYLTTKIEGVVLPTWLAVALASTAVVAIIALVLLVAVCDRLTREIRVLQLHVQDVEAVLIRERVGTRRDFAEWDAAGPPPQRDLPDDLPDDLPQDPQRQEKR